MTYNIYAQYPDGKRVHIMRTDDRAIAFEIAKQTTKGQYLIEVEINDGSVSNHSN